MLKKTTTSTIPTDRPVNGGDLEALRERLDLSAADACWLYGLSVSQWAQTVKKDAKEPVKRTTLALMVRALWLRPELCPVPKAPSVDQAFALIRQHREYIDKKRFAIMFGCEATTAYRWLTLRTKVNAIHSRLFLVFQSLVTSSSWEKDPSLKCAFPGRSVGALVADWERLVCVEAHSRGIQNVFQEGSWSSGPDVNQSKRMTGSDIDAVRVRLGLSTMDACWLFGLSMSNWTAIVKRGRAMPIKSPSLSLLVRILKAHPHVCPFESIPQPAQVFDAIAVNQRRMDAKRMAVMFGCDGSTGSVWLMGKNKENHSLNRVFKVFSGWYETSLCKRATSNAAGVLAISSWEKLVEEEAAARGVVDVFSTGRWTPTQGRKKNF